MKKKVVSIVSAIVALSAFVLLLGVAGGIEQGTISLIGGSLISLVLMAIGGASAKVLDMIWEDEE